MSQRYRLMQVQDDIDYEHRRLEGIYGDCDGKDWIAEIESYYTKKPAGYRAKIRLADHISKEVQDHIIMHVAFAISRVPRKRYRQLTLRDFLSNPTADRVQTRKFYFEKVRFVNKQHHEVKYVVKRDKATGRFAPFSEKEKRTMSSFSSSRARSRQKVN